MRNMSWKKKDLSNFYYSLLMNFKKCISFLFLTVPPSIIEKETSTDMVVREASNVTLTCKAKGYPEPYVMWRREDGKRINYNGEHGEWLWNILPYYLFSEHFYGLVKIGTILLFKMLSRMNRLFELKASFFTRIFSIQLFNTPIQSDSICWTRATNFCR